VFEYDYYFEQTSAEEKERVRQALAEIMPWLARFSTENPGIANMMNIFSQGCSRKESFLYRT